MHTKIKSGAARRFRPVARVALFLLAVVILFSAVSATYAVTPGTVKISDGKSVVSVFSSNKDPEELVRNAGFVLEKGDKLNLSEFSASEGGTIRIERSAKNSLVSDVSEFNLKFVFIKFRKETEKIGYETELITDTSMKAGEKKTVTKGEDGQQIVYYKDRYVNGQYSDSEVIKTVVTKEPVNKVVKVGVDKPDSLSGFKGSGIAISELQNPDSLKFDKNGVPKNYSKKIEGKATAYAGDGITATGIVPKPGYIAVDPKEIPYGTECYVVSADGQYVYGYCIAADTGGFVKKGNTDIDLYMNSEEMCRDWGNREVVIYIL